MYGVGLDSKILILVFHLYFGAWTCSPGRGSDGLLYSGLIYCSRCDPRGTAM